MTDWRDLADTVERILTSYDTISVVGASGNLGKAAHGVPAFMQRHGWRIIPVNPRGGELLGETAYRSLAEEDRCLAIEQRRLGLRAPRR